MDRLERRGRPKSFGVLLFPFCVMICSGSGPTARAGPGVPIAFFPAFSEVSTVTPTPTETDTPTETLILPPTTTPTSCRPVPNAALEAYPNPASGGETVTLDASATDVLSVFEYWQAGGEPQVDIWDTGAYVWNVWAYFVAPYVVQDTTLTFCTAATSYGICGGTDWATTEVLILRSDTPTETPTLSPTPTPTSCRPAPTAVADAYPNPAHSGETVTLDGSKTYHRICSFDWSQIGEGPPVEIWRDPYPLWNPYAYFTAPDVVQEATVTIRMVATSLGLCPNSDEDQVAVAILPGESPTITPTDTPFPTSTPMPADINRDGKVDELDLYMLMQEWHR